MINSRFRTLVAMFCGAAAFVWAAGGSGSDCWIFSVPGTEKILGMNNGCAHCLSDLKHGNGSCGWEITSGSGKRCTLLDVPDTYYVRNKIMIGGVCIGCNETLTEYTYKDPELGEDCTVP